ncbi:MAG: hypothetical protein IPP71_15815 [Bacteroidetes bacterium]|nr:hypothetical protein [Bacteroidota bacterium]
MAREFNSGRRGKSAGSSAGKGAKGGKSKSGWVKPDGRPLRPRKGDYFPDKEIEANKKPKSYGKDSYSKGRPDKPAFTDRKKYSDDSEGGRDQSAFKEDRGEKKPYGEKTSRYSDYKNRSDKPSYTDRRKDSDEGTSSREKFNPREDRGERKFEKKPYGLKMIVIPVTTVVPKGQPTPIAKVMLAKEIPPTKSLHSAKIVANASTRRNHMPQKMIGVPVPIVVLKELLILTEDEIRTAQVQAEKDLPVVKRMEKSGSKKRSILLIKVPNILIVISTSKALIVLRKNH